MSRWKYAERRIGQLQGGKRVPITGRSRGDVLDIQPGPRWEWLASEVKNRQVVPGFLLDGMAQAKAGAKPDQLPVVILHKVGQPYSKSLVCIEWADFAEWFGNG